MKLILTLPFTIAILASSAQTNDDPKKSIEGIINLSLELINTEPGEKIDTEKYKSLFSPSARFTVLYGESDFPSPSESVSLDKFIELLKDPYYEAGYTEVSTGMVTEQFNGLAHVFQTAYAKDSEGEEARMVSSYQLLYYENRWWIANVTWAPFDVDTEIPSKYLDR